MKRIGWPNVRVDDVRIGHCSWFGERNRSGALLILKYFTMGSGSMCATKKSPKKTKNGKSTKEKKKSPGKCARSGIWTSLELEAFTRILADVDEDQPITKK